MSNSGASAGSSGGAGTCVLGSCALETGSGAGTALHHGGGLVGDGGKSVAVEVPGCGLGRAAVGTASGVVSAVAAWAGGVAECTLESGEIVLLGNAGAADGDETIAGSFLGVLVDQTTGVEGCHVSAVKRSDFLEFTSVCDATIFGKAGICQLMLFSGGLIWTSYKMGIPYPLNNSIFLSQPEVVKEEGSHQE